MVLEFVNYKRNELSEKDKLYYRKQLCNIGKFENRLSKLNMCYNNAQHGVVPQFIDIYGFLEDIEKVVRSKNDKIVLEGTDHMDPSSRVSPLVIYFDYITGNYYEAKIRDKYVTIQYKPNNEIDAVKKYKNLIPNSKYHILVDLPQVENSGFFANVFYRCFI